LELIVEQELIQKYKKKNVTSFYLKLIERIQEFDYDQLCENETQTTSFRQDPFICNKYVRCNHGFAQKFKCHRHTAWNVQQRLCLWIPYVNCERRLLILDERLLGPNDSDESMKLNYKKPPNHLSSLKTELELLADKMNNTKPIGHRNKQKNVTAIIGTINKSKPLVTSKAI
jgi:hypothetical protein